MAVDAEELLIRPFRDVVAAGSAALANAAAHAAHAAHAPRDGPASAEPEDRMTRAAQALVREGERALTKVQSVWNANVDRHGDSFRDAMVQQASIEKRRLDLEDLLWDFDDFTHPDGFRLDRYSALQAATKALALDIVETARRLQLGPSAVPPIPPGGFPPLPPLPTRPETRSSHRSRPSSARSLRARSISKPRAPPAADKVQGTDEVVSPGPDKDIPRVPTSPGRPPPSVPARGQSLACHAPCPPARHDVPGHVITPPSSPGSGPVLARFRDLALDTSVRLGRACDGAPSPSTTTHTRTSRASILSDSSTRTSSSALPASLDSLPIADESLELDPATGGDTARAPPPMALPPAAEEPERAIIGFEDLLEQPDTAAERRKSKPVYPRVPDLTIRDCSTYYKLKGVCRGAVRFRNDGDWDGIKFTTEYDHGEGADLLRASNGVVIALQAEATKVGACSECTYSHPIEEVEVDRGNAPNAVRTSSSGARYRLRLLFKSHLRRGAGGEVHYACLWCVRAGATVRECDATVFRSADDLLRHLTRHPQPLPPVPGVDVRYGPMPDSDGHAAVPPPLFDLHLPDPPVSVPIMPDSVARLATAAAVRDHYRRPGRAKLDRPPGYDGDMLEFMEGARIVGLMFPDQWGGKFCLGWHDGCFGAFSAKAIDLRPPQESEIPGGGDSGMSLTTKWKFSPPSAAPRGMPWLAFGKGEVLSNVQCLYADYWCWSGTNSKGKTGVFPQSHVDLQTLREQESAASKKTKGRKSLFGGRLGRNADSAAKTGGDD